MASIGDARQHGAQTRARQQEAALHVVGREVGDLELALTLGAETCAWTCTGNVADRQTSQARQEIMDLLREREAMTPAEIARELGKARNNVQTLLKKLLKDGMLAKDTDGHYNLVLSENRKGEVA